MPALIDPARTQLPNPGASIIACGISARRRGGLSPLIAPTILSLLLGVHLSRRSAGPTRGRHLDAQQLLGWAAAFSGFSLQPVLIVTGALVGASGDPVVHMRKGHEPQLRLGHPGRLASPTPGRAPVPRAITELDTTGVADLQGLHLRSSSRLATAWRSLQAQAPVAEPSARPRRRGPLVIHRGSSPGHANVLLRRTKAAMTSS